MPILKSKSVEYKFSIDDIKNLISADLNIDQSKQKIDVEFTIRREVDGDPLDRYPGILKVTDVIVKISDIIK